MRLTGCLAGVVVFLSIAAICQDASGPKPQPDSDIQTAQRIAVAVLNFRQGDATGFNRSRANFTDAGWKDFIKQMQGFLDAKGAPTFTSTFVAAREARMLDEKDGVIHFRIPGTMTQSNQLGKTTYPRFALEVYAVRDSTGRTTKIQRLEQITCHGTSTACN